MQERNVLSGMTATVAVPFIDEIRTLCIWLVVAVVLILVDLRFGINASRTRGEEIRKSRAMRRTINKLVDYICWIALAWVIGGSFGRIFNIPLLAWIIMVVVTAIELTSIFDNYFQSKGIQKRFNAFRFLSKVFKIEAIEDSFEDTDKKDDKK